MSLLKDKIVLITGGGSGIGLASAALFLKEGSRVAISGRDEAKLRDSAKKLGGGDRLIYQACDVAEPKQVEKLAATVRERLGPVDILVNNAGVNIKNRSFREVTLEDWQLLVRTNLDGAFYVTRAVLPDMLKRKDGLVINVVSVAGLRSNPLGGVAYNASKFGMHAMGLSLAAEEKDNGIRVSNIYPGEVDTPILAARPVPVTEEHRNRILKAEEVAAAVLFVANQPASVSIPELVIKPTVQTFI